MMHRIYRGTRSEAGVTVTRTNGPACEMLPWRLDLWNHSPTGFEWGYGGSGPAQLALALLADVLDDTDEALELYQAFKWAVVARLPHHEWALSTDTILNWAREHDQRVADSKRLGRSGPPQRPYDGPVDLGEVLDDEYRPGAASRIAEARRQAKGEHQ